MAIHRSDTGTPNDPGMDCDAKILRNRSNGAYAIVSSDHTGLQSAVKRLEGEGFQQIESSYENRKAARDAILGTQQGHQAGQDRYRSEGRSNGN